MDLPSGNPIRVLVADDQPATRAGIRAALDVEGFEICGEATSAATAVALTGRHGPDVALVATGIKGGGIAAARRIRKLRPAITTVMLAAQLDEKELLDSLRAGADGYILKATDPARLPFILAGAVAGEAAIPRKLAARVIEELRGREQQRRVIAEHRQAVALTAREWEILHALRDGTPTAEIASRLSVSPVTVRRHVSGIVRKLRVPNREAAVQVLESRRRVRQSGRRRHAA